MSSCWDPKQVCTDVIDFFFVSILSTSPLGSRIQIHFAKSPSLFPSDLFSSDYFFLIQCTKNNPTHLYSQPPHKKKNMLSYTFIRFTHMNQTWVLCMYFQPIKRTSKHSGVGTTLEGIWFQRLWVWVCWQPLKNWIPSDSLNAKRVFEQTMVHKTSCDVVECELNWSSCYYKAPSCHLMHSYWNYMWLHHC